MVSISHFILALVLIIYEINNVNQRKWRWQNPESGDFHNTQRRSWNSSILKRTL